MSVVGFLMLLVAVLILTGSILLGISAVTEWMNDSWIWGTRDCTDEKDERGKHK